MSQDNQIPTGTVFNGKMTNADYAEIFNRVLPSFQAMSLEEKQAHRDKLSRAILAGKVEMHAIDKAITDDLDKADKEAKKAFKDRQADLIDAPASEVKRKSAEEKAFETAAKLLGISVVDFKLAQQKQAIKNASPEGTIPVCSKHGKEHIMLPDGVGCKDCRYEEKNGCCLIHNSLGDCKECKGE